MILDDILFYRKQQLEREKKQLSRRDAEAIAHQRGAARGFGEALKSSGLSVIAEVKKASPSKGVISEDFKPPETAVEYEKAGAAAISVLTEEHYFQGSNTYLEQIREKVALPLLRKDFIYDPFQVVHARALGADAILLIVAMLSSSQLNELMAAAQEYDLDTLVEVHTEKELDMAINTNAPIIGINNRNLNTFEVSLATSERLIRLIPEGIVTVVESGIKDTADMEFSKGLGAHAVLVGETLMRSEDIGATLRALRGSDET